MPSRERWIARLRTVLFRQHTGTGRLAVAVGTGVFIGLTPFYGFHALLGLAASYLLRLNIAVTVLATQVANPLLAPVLIYASAWLGSLMAGGDASSRWYDPRGPEFYAAWLRGGLLLGLLLGGIAAGITWATLRAVRGEGRSPRGVAMAGGREER